MLYEIPISTKINHADRAILPTRQMKLTKKARSVLVAAVKHDGIGARQVANILGYGGKYLRAGQYVGRLAREGWIISEMQWYNGARGREVYSHMEYFITKKGREALRLPHKK